MMMMMIAVVGFGIGRIVRVVRLVARLLASTT
jgi:hypothetical protein